MATKEYRDNNLESVRKTVSEWSKRNRDKKRESSRRYYKNHKDLVKAKNQNRRAILNNCDGKITEKEWIELKKKYNYTCLSCGRREPIVKLTIDHVIPLSVGGSNTIENSQPLCVSCNCSKGAKIIDFRM